MKKCPYCAEEIQDEAILCRYCNSRLDVEISKPQPKEQLRQPSQSTPTTKSEKQSTSWGWAIGVGITLALLAAIPLLIDLVDIAEAVNNGQIRTLAIRSWKQDFIIHLITNSIIWTIAAAFLIWLWRKNKNWVIGIVAFSLIILIGYFISKPDTNSSTISVINNKVTSTEESGFSYDKVDPEVLREIYEYCENYAATEPNPTFEVNGTTYRLSEMAQESQCVVTKREEYYKSLGRED